MTNCMSNFVPFILEHPVHVPFECARNCGLSVTRLNDVVAVYYVS